MLLAIAFTTAAPPHRNAGECFTAGEQLAPVAFSTRSNPLFLELLASAASSTLTPSLSSWPPS
jgi:hypothetical protein